jgi:glutathionylspermidine synthase
VQALAVAYSWSRYLHWNSSLPGVDFFHDLQQSSKLAEVVADTPESSLYGSQ